MKRRDAALIIAESLVEPNFPDCPICEAYAILNRLEKAGILHPDKNTKPKDAQLTENGWDSEDEKA